MGWRHKILKIVCLREKDAFCVFNFQFPDSKTRVSDSLSWNPKIVRVTMQGLLSGSQDPEAAM